MREGRIRLARSFAAVALAAFALFSGSPAHAADGGHVIHVDDDAPPGGGGTGAHPFEDPRWAVAAARAIPGTAVIKVEPGDYALGAPLVIDRSIDLRGSTEQVAGDDSWPSGEVVAGTETRVFSAAASLPQLIRVGRGDGGVLSDVSIRGFVLE